MSSFLGGTWSHNIVRKDASLQRPTAACGGVLAHLIRSYLGIISNFLIGLFD